MCQGKENVRKLIDSNPAFLAELDAKIRAMKDQIDTGSGEDSFELDTDDDDFDIKTLKSDSFDE